MSRKRQTTSGTDPDATNFDPDARKCDGHCLYMGCTDSDAENFNPDALDDDGSCKYAIPSNLAIAGDWNIYHLCVGPHRHSCEWWDYYRGDGRECLDDDVYSFGADNSFTQDMGTETWVEEWQSGNPEECAAPISPYDGSYTGATWALDASSKTLTINGAGAFLVRALFISKIFFFFTQGRSTRNTQRTTRNI